MMMNFYSSIPPAHSKCLLDMIFLKIITVQFLVQVSVLLTALNSYLNKIA